MYNTIALWAYVYHNPSVWNSRQWYGAWFDRYISLLLETSINPFARKHISQSFCVHTCVTQPYCENLYHNPFVGKCNITIPLCGTQANDATLDLIGISQSFLFLHISISLCAKIYHSPFVCKYISQFFCRQTYIVFYKWIV